MPSEEQSIDDTFAGFEALQSTMGSLGRLAEGAQADAELSSQLTI